ncbi:20472_t:CDS:2 [Gigaspora rosea]|nr:20472_t:CDS:2 [Gigaspora rosea]
MQLLVKLLEKPVRDKDKEALLVEQWNNDTNNIIDSYNLPCLVRTRIP